MLVVAISGVIVYLTQRSSIKDISDNSSIGRIHGGFSKHKSRPPSGPRHMETIVNPSAADYNDTPQETAERATSIPFSRSPSTRRIPYRDRPSICKLSLHSGQRKLLLVEAEFLTEFGPRAKTVVYAGAAPGIHIRLLAKMFPDNVFELYDPRPFSKRLENVSNIHIHQDYFTDEVAKSFASKPTLFMCDIRSGDSEDRDFEDHIVTNMQSQMRWVEMMHPVQSLLKFRLPFTPGTTQYLDGKIVLQPWAPIMSTECRLITDGKSTREYDHTTHEQQLYRHNIAGRLQTYDYPAIGKIDSPGLDRCYDCTAEVNILSNWFRSRLVTPTPALIATKINEISDELGESLDNAPHGCWPDLPLPERLAACAKEFSGKQKPARVYTANKFSVKAV